MNLIRWQKPELSGWPSFNRLSSLHQELDRLRATFAKDLLREFNVKLQTVAVQCGFVNPRHFRRTFLRETGQTPQQFRRELKAAARSTDRSGSA